MRIMCQTIIRYILNYHVKMRQINYIKLGDKFQFVELIKSI